MFKTWGPFTEYFHKYVSLSNIENWCGFSIDA